MMEISKNNHKMSKWPQIFSSLVVSLIFFNHFSLNGYATQALPQLKNETNMEVNLDEYEGSMFAAILWITGIIVSPLGGVASAWLGRKKIFIITTPILISGWIIIGLAQKKIMLFIGRIITSSAAGFSVPSTVAYISETAHPRY